jgi:hypothetical protein
MCESDKSASASIMSESLLASAECERVINIAGFSLYSDTLFGVRSGSTVGKNTKPNECRKKARSQSFSQSALSMFVGFAVWTIRMPQANARPGVGAGSQSGMQTLRLSLDFKSRNVDSGPCVGRSACVLLALPFLYVAPKNSLIINLVAEHMCRSTFLKRKKDQVCPNRP